MVALLYWNSFLNLTHYFINTVSEDIFTIINSSYCLGGLLSFIVSPFIFSDINNKNAVLISAVITFICFSTVLWSCQIFFNSILVKEFILTFGVFITGFFNSYFQSKVFSFAAGISGNEIWWFSFGCGIMGFLSNLIFFIISNTIKSDFLLTQLKQEMYCYYILITVLFLSFLVIQYIFNEKYPLAVNDVLEKKIEILLNEEQITNDKPYSMSGLKIIHRIFDVLMGITFLAVSVISVVGFFVIKANQVFDSPTSTIFRIPFFMFFFNSFECIGRLIPEKYQIKSFFTVHLVNLLAIVWIIYYILVLEFIQDCEFLKSVELRCFVNAVFGFSNGYFFNIFSNMASSRFAKKVEKSRSGYFLVFFLLIGISIGSFLGFLFNK